MVPILLAAQNAYQASCTLGSINTNGWIQINLLVILLSFSISAVIYSIAGIFPVSYAEKLKGAAKVEAFQGTVSIMIILALLAFASVSCSIGQGIVSSSQTVTQHVSYQDPIQFSDAYLSNLMFGTGLGLFSEIYGQTVLIALAAALSSTVEEVVESVISSVSSVSLSPGILNVLYGFSGAIGASFLPLIVVAFGVIFFIYLLLPLIQALALTVIVPLALVMRSIPFAGPKLRDSADTFLALAIGFYFILPLTILMNGYVISWISTSCTATTPLCNPYTQYTGSYQLANVPLDSLFSAPAVQIVHDVSVPGSYYASTGATTGGIFGALNLILQTIVNVPSIITQISLKTAEYLFSGIVLMGLDMAITLAFAQGLTKGLNSVGRIMGVGPFWGLV